MPRLLLEKYASRRFIYFVVRDARLQFMFLYRDILMEYASLLSYRGNCAPDIYFQAVALSLSYACPHDDLCIDVRAVCHFVARAASMAEEYVTRRFMCFLTRALHCCVPRLSMQYPEVLCAMSLHVQVLSASRLWAMFRRPCSGRAWATVPQLHV